MALADTELGKIIASEHSNPTKLTEENYIAYAMRLISFMQMVQATDYFYKQWVIDKTYAQLRSSVLLFTPLFLQYENGGMLVGRHNFVQLLLSL